MQKNRFIAGDFVNLDAPKILDFLSDTSRKDAPPVGTGAAQP
jgi:hypothetical protein